MFIVPLFVLSFSVWRHNSFNAGRIAPMAFWLVYNYRLRLHIVVLFIPLGRCSSSSSCKAHFSHSRPIVYHHRQTRPPFRTRHNFQFFHGTVPSRLARISSLKALETFWTDDDAVVVIPRWQSSRRLSFAVPGRLLHLAHFVDYYRLHQILWPSPPASSDLIRRSTSSSSSSSSSQIHSSRSRPIVCHHRQTRHPSLPNDACFQLFHGTIPSCLRFHVSSSRSLERLDDDAVVVIARCVRRPPPAFGGGGGNVALGEEILRPPFSLLCSGLWKK